MRPLNEKEKEEYVFRVFQSIAGGYDGANQRISIGAHMRWKRRAARALCAMLPDGCSILDIGCGTGDMLRIFSAERPRARLTGLDFSPNMLSVAEDRCRGIAQLTLRQGNAMALPFSDGSFDGACMSFALRNTADYSRTLREAARVLRPGGVMLVIDSFVPQGRLVRPFYDLYFSKLMPLLGGGFRRRREYDWLTRSTREFISTDRLRDLMGEAGLTSCGGKAFMFGACAYVLGRKNTEGDSFDADI